MPSRKQIHAYMRRVNEWQKQNPVMPPDNRNWERATWYTGVMAAWTASGDRRFYRQAVDWGRQHKWQPGTEPFGANRLFCSETWLELYFELKDPAMVRPTVAWLDTNAPNSPAGASRWYLEGNHSYVDSLYGAVALAMLAKATGQQRYLEIMQAFFDDVTVELFDTEAGLYYRDNRFIGRRTPNGRKIFWSRGNGWAFAGIARLLEYLPESHPRRPQYLELFQRMADAIVAAQGADGLWRPNLHDPEGIAVPETSGTGFFCFGLAWGVNRGVLDRNRFLAPAKRAWTGLCRSVTADGKVEWGQQVDAAPNPVRKESTHEYVTGTFLLAASEMYRLAGR